MQEIDWTKQNKCVKEIALGDANFGVFKQRDIDIAKYIRQIYDNKESNVDIVLINYLKNSTDALLEIAEIFGDMMFMGITISKQSDNQDTLQAIKRQNIKHDNYATTLEKANKKNILTYTELVLPLPLETVDSFKQGILNVLEGGQHTHIDVFQTQVLTHAELSNPDYIKKYGIKTTNMVLQEGSEWAEAENVDVIVETNTMTSEELLDCWEFVFIISHIHLSGYSEIVSRYLRHTHNVTFADFYQELHKKLYLDDVFRKIVTEDRSIRARHYNLPQKNHNDLDINTDYYGGLRHKNNREIAQNADRLFDIVVNTGETFARIPEVIKQMQKYYVIAPKIFLQKSDYTYPMTFNADHDFINNNQGPVKYILTGEHALRNPLNHGQSRWKSKIEIVND